MMLPLWVSFVIMAFSFAGAILSARKSNWCWHVWLISTVLGMFYWWPRGEWGAFLAQFGYTVVNVYGLVMWRRGTKVAEEQV